MPGPSLMRMMMSMLMVMAFVMLMFVLMRVMFQIEPAGHDEDASPQTHNIDFRSVESRQDRAGNDVIDGAECCLAVAEIEHAVDRR